MSEQSPSERVLTALNGGKPDRIPWCEASIAENLRRDFCGGGEPKQSLEERLGICNVVAAGSFCPPGFIELGKTDEGHSFVKDGLLKKREDLEKMVFPDPDAETMYEPLRLFLKSAPKHMAACVVTDLGAGAAVQSMGIEGLSYALADDPDFVKEVFRGFAEWSARVHQNLCRLGLDFIWSGGDIAFKTAPFISPPVFREIILPFIRLAAEAISIPWVYHSDGNLGPILDDLLSLGMNAIHPVEPGAMDIFELKLKYGNRLCLVGNVGVDVLARGKPSDVVRECRRLVDFMADKGAYIISSSNSLTSYVNPENLKVMGDFLSR